MKKLVKTAAKVATKQVVKKASIPVAVQTASLLGVEAGTGTAISSLSGAAATSATAAAVGGTVIEGAAAIGIGVTAAPAVVGAAVIGGIGIGVACLIDSIFD